LQKALVQGWVSAEWKQSENNRRARYYSLTPAGREHMAKEISEYQRVALAISRVIQPA
jgi:PadR family transcriptional regulator, regulatory protein PadR